MQGEGVGFVEDGAVAIDGRKIVAVGPRTTVEANDRARQAIDATNRLVMPGLIDAHVHSAATLARGLAQEVETWMGSAYGPLIRHATDDDAHLWTTLALMEGIAAGTTTFGDYEAPMEQLIQVHRRTGNRAVVCQGVTEIDWNQRERWIEQGWRPGEPALLDPEIGETSLAEELALFDTWNGADDGRIRVVIGPIAADMVSEAMLLRCQR